MTESDDSLTVEAVDARRLHELRRRVLRGNDPAASVVEPRDDEPTSLHLACLAGDQVVACASFFAAPYEAEPDLVAYQLRFMAVDPDRQGRGLGERVLAEAERRLVARSARLLWAHARDSALGFYRSVGWSIVPGSEFLSAETQLPHTVIVKALNATSTRPDLAR